MERITHVEARAIPDSRGTPTVEVTVACGNIQSIASVPSGKSAGTKEACELRDADGTGVSGAVANVNTTIRDLIVGLPLDPLAIDQKLIDLDGTPNKSRLGANAVLGVSIATMRLAAQVGQLPLWKYIADVGGFTPDFPRLYMNMLNGGAHASFRLPFQEYIAAVGGVPPKEAYAKANTIFKDLGVLVSERYPDVVMGDEGGYSPSMTGIEKPLALLAEAVKGDANTFLAIDAAASEFFSDGTYNIEGTSYSSSELLAIYERLVNEFHVESIEDPFNETDLSAFHEITKRFESRLLVIGDDLTVTNPKIALQMIEGKHANGMIIKPNQIGTLFEVFDTVRLAQEAGWRLVASHRSGETEDPFIADLAVGIGAYGLKAGAPTQAVRRAKYERLLEIEHEFTR